MEYEVNKGKVKISGVDITNPIIYDNDWFEDVCDDELMGAIASLYGNLMGIIVTRDMNDDFDIEDEMREAKESVNRMKNSNMQYIPDPVYGAENQLSCPAGGKIEDTEYKRTEGSELIVKEAHKASTEKPLLVIIGGQPTTAATAYLQDSGIADKVVIFHVSPTVYNGVDTWAAYICSQKFRWVEWGTKQWWHKEDEPLSPRILPQNKFKELPENEVCNHLRDWTELPRWTNGDDPYYGDPGDGAPALWLLDPSVWSDIRKINTCYKRGEFILKDTKDEDFDGLSAISTKKDMYKMGKIFFRVMKDPKVYHKH